MDYTKMLLADPCPLICKINDNEDNEAQMSLGKLR